MALDGESLSREELLMGLAEDGSRLEFCSLETRSDRDMVLVALNSCPDALRYATLDVRGDREVVMAAVRQTGNALFMTPDRIRSDREVVLCAVSNTHAVAALACADPLFRDDEEIVLRAVESCGEALWLASARLKKNRDIVMAAVKRNGAYLEFASDELKADREVVETAVRENGNALFSIGVPPGLRRDLGLQLLSARHTKTTCFSDDAPIFLASRSAVAFGGEQAPVVQITHAAVAPDGHADVKAALMDGKEWTIRVRQRGGLPVTEGQLALEAAQTLGCERVYIVREDGSVSLPWDWERPVQIA